MPTKIVYTKGFIVYYDLKSAATLGMSPARFDSQEGASILVSVHTRCVIARHVRKIIVSVLF